MAYATPPATLYDVANLQNVQNWANPALVVLEKRRQDQIRAQEFEREANRIFGIQKFQQDQQERQIKGYGDNQKAAIAERNKYEEEESKKQRTAAEDGYKRTGQSLTRIRSALEAASKARDNDLHTRVEKIARAQALAENKDFDKDNKQHQADLDRIRAEVYRTTPPDTALEIRIRSLQFEEQKAITASNALLQNIVRYGGEVPEDAEAQGMLTAPMEPERSPLDEGLLGNGSEVKTTTRKRDTEGIIPEFLGGVGGLVKEVGGNVKRDLVDPATTALKNAMAHLFGGDYQVTDDLLGPLAAPPPQSPAPFGFNPFANVGPYPIFQNQRPPVPQPVDPRAAPSAPFPFTNMGVGLLPQAQTQNPFARPVVPPQMNGITPEQARILEAIRRSPPMF